MKLILIIHFISPNRSKILSFQHVTNIKLLQYFTLLFLLMYCAFEFLSVLGLWRLLGPAVFQVLDSADPELSLPLLCVPRHTNSCL